MDELLKRIQMFHFPLSLYHHHRSNVQSPKSSLPSVPEGTYVNCKLSLQYLSSVQKITQGGTDETNYEPQVDRLIE